jgi:type I restriction enzyme S subunit
MRTVPLGDICQFQYGNSLPASIRDGIGYDVYGSNGVVGSHNEGLTTGPTVIIGRKGSVGEINFSDSSCWPIDTTYYVDSGSTQQNLRWLFYALKNLKLQALNKATGVPGLNRNDAYRLEIPLPPLEEQKRIAAILDQADDIRRKRQHAIERLNQLGQAIFYEMFGDPVSNPMGWDKVKFSDIVADETGGNIKTLQSDYLSSGHYPIVDQGQEKIGGFTNEADRICKAKLPVIVFGDHTKCFKFIDFPFCLGADGTKILKSKGQVDDLYLFYAIQKIHIPDAGYSRHFKYLKDGEICLPNLQNQRQFSNLIREIEGRTKKMVSAKSASESLFTSLQHRAFTGQL